MGGKGVVFFDLTQLVLRVAFPTPSGIGRVELAYATYLLERYPDQVRFVFALKSAVCLIPNRLAKYYVNALRTMWAEGGPATEKIESEIQLRIDGRKSEGPSFHSEYSPAYANRWERARLGLHLLTNLILHLPRRHNLSKYGSSHLKHAYVNVSNSIIGSEWIDDWLAKSPSVSGIFLLHDLIPITNPEFTKTRTTIRHNKHLRKLASTADIIIATSTYTYDCLNEYSEERQLKFPDVTISPLGVDGGFIEGSAARPPSTPYFVFTATIEPRKNHLMLLQVWQRLAAKLGSRTPKLVLVGRRGWENENILDLLERATELQKFVIECGNVPDRLLVKLIGGANAALFPSHVEGYGLPLAEALALGVPVICSDIPPFREIAGDIPEYVDPLAGRGWLKVISEYADLEHPKRTAQFARAKRFAPHTWDDHLSVLDSVLREKGVVLNDAGDGEAAVSRATPQRRTTVESL